MARQEFFGEIAVRLGFVRRDQVEQALATQKRAQGNGQAHKLIGMHLLDAGALTSEQLIEVLREMERQRATVPTATGRASLLD
ncbi:MAG: hypothetical protein AAB434_04025 [Planctomycetota bacterium]